MRLFEIAFGLTLLALSLLASYLLISEVQYWTMPKAIALGGTTVLGILIGIYFVARNIKLRPEFIIGKPCS